MLRTLGYYIFFITLIALFGLSGISDLLDSRFIYVFSGIIIAVAIGVALWITFNRRTLPNILHKQTPQKVNSVARNKTQKRQTKTKRSHKVKTVSSFVILLLVFCGITSPAFSECISTPERMNDLLSHCYVCEFVSLLMGAINSVVTESYNLLNGWNGPAILVLAVALGLWLAWHIGNYFVTYKYSDPMEFLSEIGRCFFRVTLVAAILAVSAGTAIDLVISPFVSGATELTLGIINTDIIDDIAASSGMSIQNYCNVALSETDLSNGKALSPQFVSSIVCIVQAIYFEAVKGLAVGLGIYCFSLGNGIGIPGIIALPDFGMMFLGAIIFVVFFVIAFSVSFRIIDFVMRIAFVLMLLPLLFVAWVFPSSRKYTVKAWGMFINSLVSFVVIAIAIALILKLLFAVLGDSQTLDTLLNEDRMKDLYDFIYTNGIDWLLFVAILFMCILITKSSVAIAQQIAPLNNQDLANASVSSATGALLASTALTLVKTATNVAMIVATVATAGAGGVAAGAVKVGAQVASTAAKAAATASRAASHMGRFGAAAIKAGQAVSRVAGTVGKATKTVVNTASNAAKSITGAYRNIRRQVSQVAAKQTARVSRRLGSTKTGYKTLKVARAFRTAGGKVGGYAKDRIGKLPSEVLNKINDNLKANSDAEENKKVE